MSAFLTSWPFCGLRRMLRAIRRRGSRHVRYDRDPWLFLASDPSVGARDSLVGGMLTWIKAISLICLVCWVVSWLIIGIKERIIGAGPLV